MRKTPMEEHVTSATSSNANSISGLILLRFVRYLLRRHGGVTKRWNPHFG
jgi:hypothetical protein